MLTKDGIAAVDDLPCKTLPVPMWGDDVRLRLLKEKEADGYQQMARSQMDASGAVIQHRLKSMLVALVLVDDAGNRLFTDSDEDIDILEDKSAAAIDLIWQCAADMNGMTESAAEAIAGNSESAPRGA